MNNFKSFTDGDINRMEVGKDDIRNNIWIARLFTQLDDGKEVYLDTISAQTREAVVADGFIRIRECRVGMKHHRQIA